MSIYYNRGEGFLLENVKTRAQALRAVEQFEQAFDLSAQPIAEQVKAYREALICLLEGAGL